MGRKPNQVIASYFHRGPKLADNSNRYPHTCKLCGEDFPKGRIDSLTSHITKPGKCPAISESARIQACLALHSIPNPAALQRKHGARAGENGASPADASMTANWSALEALAEASRRVNMSEKHDNRDHESSPVTPSPSHYMVGAQFTLDNPPTSYGNPTQAIRAVGGAPPEGEGSSEARQDAAQEPSPTDAAHISLPLPGPPEASIDSTNLSVAAAAAARLHPSFLDPQLIAEEVTASLAPTTEPSHAITDPLPPQNASSPPWGEITYLATSPTAVAHHHHEALQAPVPLQKGGVRMDTGDGSANGRPRHSRARFDPTRRKEVQEVRKIGACIRCRILRKNCGKGNPCDTCRKVLSPRVWRSGCVRTRLHEQLDLYSAGVQVVLAQRRYNLLKSSLRIANTGTIVEASQFPDTGHHILLPVFQTLVTPPSSPPPESAETETKTRSVMIDCEAEDIPNVIEGYMRQVLPVLIEREPSHFVRVLLETAAQLVEEPGGDLLRRALELWGLVEIIDRERQWKLMEKRPGEDNSEPRYIRETSEKPDLDVYTIMCLQLNAAAERKANATSMTLLNGMQRILQDSKIKIGFPMFITALVFLNCVEKSTWSFKAWEQDEIRVGWPLEREPGSFTSQGETLASLLRLLLIIRRVLPPTERAESGKLILCNEADPVTAAFFHNLDLDFDVVQSRRDKPEFDPGDSRSLELAFCSHLLLPKPAV
ncbi:Uncharacterized protein SAPIO_CDS7234 [Scedosporium apiospermum]|uniref:Zn(2)-C6 fungal-type domain-containing protein n=1 Tax=Pseudallescheria apiosperma TaxID=563466 RepID=A0A084G1E4_PSEDA|nr:Uncharacterized protein SAPIO_CDS7234 [Scedosporium apiospermum]KEZ41156.1 Uncharacterized protein SAPIO_CDS7234 [Scedosporium apiospermum]